MRLQLAHTTTYTYSEPVPHALQQLRLHAKDGPAQQILRWNVEVTGAHEHLRYTDHHGNLVTLVGIEHGNDRIEIAVTGDVVTTDTAGVLGPHAGRMPLWGHLRHTPLTQPGPLVDQLIEDVDPSGHTTPDYLHSLAARIADRVDYETGSTTSTSTAEDALRAGSGVCQDHAHIFIAAARQLGIPARYVSGHLLITDTIEQSASHAWAEAHLDDLGWVGFDISNRICPDDRYLQLAVGLDYHDAAPVSGIRLGGGEEHMDVSIAVAEDHEPEIDLVLPASDGQSQAQQ